MKRDEIENEESNVYGKYQQEDNWFIAQCLEVDIASQGESEEAALDNLTEALELYFESPQPSLKPVFKEIIYAICC